MANHAPSRPNQEEDPMPTTRIPIPPLVSAFATLVAALAFASAPASAGDGRFGTGTQIGMGAPYSIAIGDFNSDDRPDFAAINHAGLDVNVRLGAGDGGFSTAPNVSAGMNPEMLVVADFNADGHDDLAVTDVAARNARVRLGRGDGRFTNAPDVPFVLEPVSAVVGDFNGDNRDDLAVSSNSDTGDGKVQVRLGAGDGTFTAGGEANVTAGPLTVGDFNSDGIEDLAYGAFEPDTRGFVGGVLLGTGGGAIAAGRSIPVPGPATASRGWAVGDFNSDGNQDLVATVPNSDVASVRLGAGDGTFVGGPDVPVGDRPMTPVVADFNGDGNEDLAVTNRNDGSVSVRLGNGSGGFVAAPTVSVEDGPIDLALADLDSDGNEDLLVSNYGGRSVSVRPGLGAPALAGNLLTNGGFEGPAARLHTQSPPPAIPGWERSGGMTHIRYGIPAHDFFPSRLPAARWNGGQSLLWGGNSAATAGITRATQTVDVYRSAASIDTGRARASLSAHLGGALNIPDVMDVRAEFLSDGGGTLGSLAIGPVTVADRKFQTTLLRRAGSAPVPVGTRRIRVTLTSTDDDKSYSSATADNVKLTLDAPAPPAAGPGIDRQAPAIGRLTLAPRRFKVARRATARTATRGTRIRYTLSEPATVTLRFQRLRRGRRVEAGTLRRAGRAGANRVAFSGRIGRRALRRGTYRLIVTAVDAAGNRSQPRRTRFRVVR
jgi:hypothetical protein